jgi:hypothetical protein
MIGGYDVFESGSTSNVDLDVLLRCVRAEWPNGVLEVADGSTTMSIREGLKRRWDAPCEFFLYESRTSYDAWTRDGFTDEHSSSMLSVTVEPDGIAFVVDAKDSRSHQLVAQATDAIRNNRRTLLKAA